MVKNEDKKDNTPNETETDESLINNSYFKATLLKTLKQKVYENHALPRTKSSFSINSEVAQEFYRVCYDLDLAGYRRGANQVLEACMSILIELYKSESKQVNLFYKPTINKNTLLKIDNLTVTDRIELKLVKEDLNNVLLGFDMPDPSKNYVKQLNQHLKKVLPKAIQWKRMTQDPDLNELIIKAEKHLK
jgi:predicted HicB family RNase H-like nuclease